MLRVAVVGWGVVLVVCTIVAVRPTVCLSASTNGMGPLCLVRVVGEAGRVSVGADPRADAANSRSPPRAKSTTATTALTQ